MFAGCPEDPFDVDKRLAVRAAKILTRHRAKWAGSPSPRAETWEWYAPTELGRERADFILRHGLKDGKRRRPHTMPQHILRALHRDRDDRVKAAAKEAESVDDAAELRRKWDAAIAQREIDNRHAEELERRARDVRSAPERERVERIMRQAAVQTEEQQAMLDRLRVAQEKCSLCQAGVFCAEHTAAGFLQ